MIGILNIQTFVKLFLQDSFKPSNTHKKEFFISSCSILFTVKILFLVNLLIYLFYPDNSEALRIEAEKIISPLYYFRISPEPIEHLQILTSLILMPLLIVCCIKIFSSKLFSQISIADNIYFFNLALCFSLLGILVYYPSASFSYCDFFILYKTVQTRLMRIITAKTITVIVFDVPHASELPVSVK